MEPPITGSYSSGVHYGILSWAGEALNEVVDEVYGKALLRKGEQKKRIALLKKNDRPGRGGLWMQ